MGSSFSQSGPVTVKGTLRTLRILHIAITASIALYAVVLLVITQQPSDTEHMSLSDATGLAVALGIASLAVLALIPFLRKRIGPARDESAGARRSGSAEGELSNAERTAVGKLMSAELVSYAMGESVAVFGLVLGLITRQFVIFLPFAALALLQLILLTPSQALLDSVIAAATKGEQAGD
jgi:F0F1-type ATP synthase membrane subunit c/vacuolar-type H+-ATPase subunit K